VDVEGSGSSPIIRTNLIKNSHKFPVYSKREHLKFKSCFTCLAKVLDKEEEEEEDTYGKC
jgi:hypothetical protein